MVALALFLLASVSSFASPALAAGLSLSPSSGTYAPGTTFTVAVYVDSEGQALNAVSGVITFPADTLSVVGVSKSQSIISLWVEEPGFSNTNGTVNFEGVALNPGYTGARGKVLDITFAVKATGAANLTFSNGSILANDGEGSELLTSRGSAQFTLVGTAVPQDFVVSDGDREEMTASAQPELLPEVASVSNPAAAWSKEETGTFNFTVPEGVVAMRLLIDTKPNSIPTVVYQPPLTEKTIEGLADGISYLHVQYKSADGWGDILHYELRVDTVPPAATPITVVSQDTFLVGAEDVLSGVARYEIQVDGGGVFTLAGEEAAVFILPSSLALTAGKHVLTVTAFDQAGNSTATTTSFDFTPVEVVTPTVEAEATPDPLAVTYSLLLPKGAILITILSVVIPLLALVLLLGALLYFVWRSVGGLRRRVEREAKEASDIVRQAFYHLRADLEVDIETLKKAHDKRKLTREEAKILKRLQANLDTAEQAIGVEIADIVKEVDGSQK